MPHPTFHFAILGLGNIARKFAQDLALIDDAKLVAVGSRSLERAQAFARDFDAPYAAGSYAATFDGPRVDAVYIATPHVDHLRLAIMCLEKGIPVICEKPMGLNLTEVEQAVRLARENKVYLMEALWTRFLPSTLKLKEMIDAGVIGTIESIRSDFGFRAQDLELALQPFSAPATAPENTDRHPAAGLERNRILNPELGGGALLDIGIYPQFLSQFLLGPPEKIYAQARLSPQGIDLDTSVTCVHASGRMSHNYSTVLGRTKTEALIIGSKASLHWHPRWHEPSSFSLLTGKDTPPENFYFDFGGANGYRYEAEAVMADVRAGLTENARWSLDDSLALHRTLTEVRRMVGVRYPGEGL
ncbi:Gfo/Idh/MocA family protein [Neolewinella persica]|uniref:Gfo/Idh/MocA family protein n=1 Tax=Neolewinella persica TaxID=70998 RepID=UPI00036BD8EF|nr:Gfo/Idh/MocA family oxidoreductase [Neolewinella persica]